MANHASDLEQMHAACQKVSVRASYNIQFPFYATRKSCAKGKKTAGNLGVLLPGKYLLPHNDRRLLAPLGNPYCAGHVMLHALRNGLLHLKN